MQAPDGKSTLIARFIIEHVSSGENPSLPFVHLDSDRRGLSPTEPLRFLIEATRQITVQSPAYQEGAENLMTKMSIALQREGGGLESLNAEDWQAFICDFSDIARKATAETATLLLVLDTIEDVQFLGESAVSLVWTFLEILQNTLDHSWVIVSGRAPLVNRNFVPLELAG